jgi:hypothetical protein
MNTFNKDYRSNNNFPGLFKDFSIKYSFPWLLKAFILQNKNPWLFQDSMTRTNPGYSNYLTHSVTLVPSYLLTLPLFRGSLPHKSLISRMDWVSCAGDINLPHDIPPTKKKYNKILTYILGSIFLEIPHLELPHWWKTPRDTNGKGV